MIKIPKVIKYIFAGGIATLSNLGILFICVNFFNLWYLISAIISFSFGVVISYLLQKFLVFKDYRKEDINMQFINFFVYNIIMLGLNTFLMFLLVDIIEVYYIISQVIVALIIAIINYNYFRKFIFVEDISQ